jgi:hypoxanthine phosphoribosyltransferase
MDTIFYGFEQFDHDMRSIVHQIGSRRFDLIVGVARGGCLPAVCLSHTLKIPATMVDWSTRDGANVRAESINDYFERISGEYDNILIVDDLIDSGRSMSELIRTAKKFCNVSVATLLHNTDVHLGVDHYRGTEYNRTDEPRYFDFWWEMYGTSEPKYIDFWKEKYGSV